ncbi:MAG TPA: tRNA epoxyqueuosine(34) reductase QueG [Chloroflexota bacterium]|nr:tRNA epoxyqueuosine(34) reductase QueG [Chloroflexota bacterium]
MSQAAVAPILPSRAGASERQLRSRRVKDLALEAGFDLVGIALPDVFERERAALAQRIDAGLFSGLPWFTRDRAEVASDPRALLPEARSVIALALSYDTGDGPAGVIARYAWGQDYHEVIRGHLKSLQRRLAEEFGEFEFRNFVDTGRLVDRAAAARAGLGWYGKNTNLLNTTLGSWLFLAELVTTLDLQPDEPTRQNCGQCHACIDVCPTGAITAPYVVDNNRCISFLTIELRGPIPRDLRPLMGSYIFGCDLCQDVCPVNAQAQPVHHPEFAFQGQLGTVDELAALLLLSEDDFRARFRHTAIMRTKRRGLLRNVCVALGNSGAASAVGPLIHALRTDPEPLVRGHAAWATGRLRHPPARQALQAAAQTETDPYVLEEIACALTPQ